MDDGANGIGTHQSAYNRYPHYCSLGVKNADESELRSIATDPDSIHMFNVVDFGFLLEIVDTLTDNLCNSVKGPGVYELTAKYAHTGPIQEGESPRNRYRKYRDLLLCTKYANCSIPRHLKYICTVYSIIE